MIVAGAGQAGREFCCRMATRWRVIAVDPLAYKLERLQQLDSGAEVVQGDATSSFVLKQAGAASVLVAVTGNDEINLEICRAATEARVPRLFSLLINHKWRADFMELGVELISRPSSVASVLQTRLDPGRRTSSELGLGRGELIEVTVLPHSPMVGKALEHMRPTAWLVAAIYRDSELIVPHGRTVLEARDRVLLAGQPEVLPAIADYLRSGVSEFPLQYGSFIIAADPTSEGEGYSVSESFYLARETQALGLKVLCSQEQEPRVLKELSELAQLECEAVPSEDWAHRLSQLHQDYDCGCLVLPAPTAGIWDLFGLGHRGLFEFLSQARQPCLFARGSFPYRRILVATSEGEGPAEAVELAVEVSRVFGATLTAITVLPPEFVTGEEHNRKLRESVDRAAYIGSLYSVQVTTGVLEGNPVHSLVEAAAEQDLLVISHRSHTGFNPITPDVSRHLLLRAPCSVLVLPHE